MMTKKLHLRDNNEALQLLGQRDTLLRQMEQEYGVELFLREDTHTGQLVLSVRGNRNRVEKAYKRIGSKIHGLRGSSHSGGDLPEPINLDSPSIPHDGVYRTHSGKVIRARTAGQQRYIEAIETHELVFGIGPAGTGKTYLAVACALRALELRQVSRIILSRPVVEAGEKLGFLPGDMLEKVNPYLKPLYDAFYAMLGPDRFRMWRDTEVVEIVPLAYMRGRTFEDAYIILDEAQNTTPEQMKMFLTRMGLGSRMIVTGDVTQTDLGDKVTSGLVKIESILKDVEGVSFHRLSEDDVVRHPLVKRIIRAYDQQGRK
jgi:phosphate starvation-inducible PhoH-like protein